MSFSEQVLTEESPPDDRKPVIKWLDASDQSTAMTISITKGPVLPSDIATIAKKLEKIKEQTPTEKVVVQFDQAILGASALIEFALLIEKSNYPSGMTINLFNFSVTNLPGPVSEQLSKALINALIRSQSKGLHLTISEFIFEVLGAGFYDILRYSQCLESLRLKRTDPKSTNKIKILRDDEIAGALRSNTHLLKLEIDDDYYDYDTTIIPSDLFSSFVPDFFSTEVKQESVSSLLSRNHSFKERRTIWITDFFQQTMGYWPHELTDLIAEYSPFFSSPEEDEKMAATALDELTSLKAIKKNGFKTFCNIYLNYRTACQEACKKDPRFPIVLRQYMRSFFAALEQATYNNPANWTYPFSDDLVFFIQLAKITPAELERQIVFLRKMPPKCIQKLRSACIAFDAQILDFTIRHDTDFKEILGLKPGSIVHLKKFGKELDKKSMYFDEDLATRFCSVLTDKKCPQNLTIVISKTISHLYLIHGLTEVIRQGTYPKGTCIIYRKGDPFYLGFASLFKVLTEETSDKPELHLILPILQSSSDKEFGANFASNLFDLIVRNKYLKTLVISKYRDLRDFSDRDPCIPPELINALKINDTLTTFDMNVDISDLIECTFPGQRNQQFILDQCGVSFYRAPMILSQEFKDCKETSFEIDPLFINLLWLAIDRYRGNLSVLFNWTFLDFFKKNVVLIMQQLWWIARERHYFDVDKRHEFDELTHAILPAAKITVEDIQQDTTQDEDVRKYLLNYPLQKTTEPSISAQPTVTLEHSSGPDLFKHLDFVLATVMFFFGTKTHPLIEYAKTNNLNNFQQKIRDDFSSGQISLSTALQLSFLIKESKNDISFGALDTEINRYDENKGRFRQFFNTRTRTVNDLRNLSTEMSKQGNQKISAFQIELCLMARDKRNSFFSLRSGIICRSVAFFKSGEITDCQKTSCRVKTEADLSQTEHLIKRLSNNAKITTM